MRCRRGSPPPEGDAAPTGSVSGGRSQAEMDLELFGVGSQFDGLVTLARPYYLAHPMLTDTHRVDTKAL